MILNNAIGVMEVGTMNVLYAEQGVQFLAVPITSFRIIVLIAMPPRLVIIILLCVLIVNRQRVITQHARCAVFLMFCQSLQGGTQCGICEPYGYTCTKSPCEHGNTSEHTVA